jgi:hypothetical protein
MWPLIRDLATMCGMITQEEIEEKDSISQYLEYFLLFLLILDGIFFSLRSAL